MLGDFRGFSDGGGHRPKTPASVQSRVPRLPILVTRRDAVSNHSQRKPVHTRRNRILLEAKDVLLNSRRKTTAPSGIQHFVKQDLIRQQDAQSKRRVIKLELETGQSGRVDQGDRLQLCAPGAVGNGRVVEPQGKNAIPGDPPSRKDFQGNHILRA